MRRIISFLDTLLHRKFSPHDNSEYDFGKKHGKIVKLLNYEMMFHGEAFVDNDAKQSLRTTLLGQS